MRVVITGSEGFIGSRLRFPGHEWLCIDQKLDFDLMWPKTVEMMREFDPDIVFHLAAHHYIPWCEANPKATRLLNVMGTGMALSGTGPNLKAFVLASSAAVYGFYPTPISEANQLAGTGVYAESKQDAEGRLLRFAELNRDVSCVAARLFNVVGPGDPWPHVLPEIVRQRYGEVLLGNTWPKRDYVHVDDAADALMLLGAKAPVGFSAWNVGTGIGTNVLDLVNLVGMRAKIQIRTGTYAGKVRTSDGHLVADPASLRMLGWEARRTLADAIDGVLADAS